MASAMRVPDTVVGVLRSAKARWMEARPAPIRRASSPTSSRPRALSQKYCQPSWGWGSRSTTMARSVVRAKVMSDGQVVGCSADATWCPGTPTVACIAACTVATEVTPASLRPRCRTMSRFSPGSRRRNSLMMRVSSSSIDVFDCSPPKRRAVRTLDPSTGR